MPHLARKPFPRFEKRPVEKIHGVPVQEYGLMPVYCGEYLVPDIGDKYTRHSHI
jgi:hypothetical protein